MTLLKDVFVLSGAGVGGGSLVYANTLPVPKDAAWDDPVWSDLDDWKTVMPPFYATAKRMLGVAPFPRKTRADEIVEEYARSIGTADTFEPAPVGVWFGEPGKEVPDPYFGGEGPSRTGCIQCGGCMVGCQHNAKNTLDKNYLYLAENRGVQIIPETRVTGLRPMEGGGYVLDVERSTSRFFKKRRTMTAGQVVLSGGVLGTVPLLMECQHRGMLKDLSPQLGNFVRTNNEAIVGLSIRDDSEDFTDGVAITSKVALDEHTHLEPVRYSAGSDALSPLSTLLTDGGGSVPRALRWVATCVRHPLDFVRTLPGRLAGPRSLLYCSSPDHPGHMQGEDAAGMVVAVLADPDLECGGVQGPTYIPAANDAARAIAKKHNAFP